MLGELLSYHTKIQKHQQSISDRKQNLYVKIQQLFHQYLKQLIQHHMQFIYKPKCKLFQKQMATLDYFIHCFEHKDDQSFQDQQKLKKEINRTNIYSVLKTIDDKISFNEILLEDIEFNWVYPKGSKLMKYSHIPYLNSQIQILKDHLSSVYTILKTQNQDSPIKKLNKKLQKIAQKYELIEQDLFPEKYESEGMPIYNKSQICIKDKLKTVLANLSRYKYVKVIKVSIITQNGKLNIRQYQNLMEILNKNDRLTLQQLELKIMDMQFCQQKCDILRRNLSKFKYLNSLIIYNYYKQCKLGIFTDFTWKPYRPGVNIGNQVWK